MQAAVLIAEVVLGAVVDGADEDSTAQGSTAQERNGAFEGASLVILVRCHCSASITFIAETLSARHSCQCNR